MVNRYPTFVLTECRGGVLLMLVLAKHQVSRGVLLMLTLAKSRVDECVEEVQNKGQQISSHALVRCEYNMANFSTGDRMRKPKGDIVFGDDCSKPEIDDYVPSNGLCIIEQ
ncbi:hypothetical protein Fmac_008470 [Flemingia macrophylla]|uniref:Uncharacterized protein n=1 Tax=Flemingia macrophylla TaxID=520843 RepID=A0ABD1MXG6_9FABA